MWAVTWMSLSPPKQADTVHYLMQLVVSLDNIGRIGEALLLIEVRLLAPPRLQHKLE
jgi:hypothetical protein